MRGRNSKFTEELKEFAETAGQFSPFMGRALKLISGLLSQNTFPFLKQLGAFLLSIVANTTKTRAGEDAPWWAGVAGEQGKMFTELLRSSQQSLPQSSPQKTQSAPTPQGTLQTLQQTPSVPSQPSQAQPQALNQIPRSAPQQETQPAIQVPAQPSNRLGSPTGGLPLNVQGSRQGQVAPNPGRPVGSTPIPGNVSARSQQTQMGPASLQTNLSNVGSSPLRSVGSPAGQLISSQTRNQSSHPKQQNVPSRSEQPQQELGYPPISLETFPSNSPLRSLNEQQQQLALQILNETVSVGEEPKPLGYLTLGELASFLDTSEGDSFIDRLKSMTGNVDIPNSTIKATLRNLGNSSSQTQVIHVIPFLITVAQTLQKKRNNL